MKTIKTMGKESASMEVSRDENVASGPEISSADLRRRNLVRGAVAFAPLVLTLRSGALAAASCTGAKIVNIPASGNFTTSSSSDVCIPEADICPGAPLTGTTKIVTHTETKIPVTSVGGGLYRCDKPTGGYYTGNMAILSSHSAASIV